MFNMVNCWNAQAIMPFTASSCLFGLPNNSSRRKLDVLFDVDQLNTEVYTSWKIQASSARSFSVIHTQPIRSKKVVIHLHETRSTSSKSAFHPRTSNVKNSSTRVQKDWCRTTGCSPVCLETSWLRGDACARRCCACLP